MAGGKRASMREGPLANLFRRTDELEEGWDEEGPAGARQDRPPSREDRPPSREDRPPSREDHAPDAARPPARPHPSLGPGRSLPFEEEAPYIPTAQDRLRSAFAADVPDNVLDPSDAPAHRPAREPAPTAPERPAPAPGRMGHPVIRVVGVGGAGVNAVNRMVEAEVAGVEFLALNTDLQSLGQSSAHATLHIGECVTRGLGSGSDPMLGRQAAMEDYDRIKAMLKGSDMVFIAAGAGGGTGTGAAPVVARIAHELGALTVGIVSKPFGFEGSRRRDTAEEGVEGLAAEVDTLIVVPNNRLLSVLSRGTSMVDAFRVADDVLRQGVQGISDLVTLPGLINLDFADVRTIMSEAGSALLGIGMGTGERRAIDASEQAVASPLLETSMDGAHSILLSITGGRDLSLWEVNEAAKAVSEAAHPDANIIFGAMIDEKLDDQVWVTVVATGYGTGPARPPRRVEDESRTEWREPRGEPRVARTSPARHLRRVEVPDLDVPEFMPPRR